MFGFMIHLPKKILKKMRIMERAHGGRISSRVLPFCQTTGVLRLMHRNRLLYILLRQAGAIFITMIYSCIKYKMGCDWVSRILTPGIAKNFESMMLTSVPCRFSKIFLCFDRMYYSWHIELTVVKSS
jgi:hypothetical protein